MEFAEVIKITNRMCSCHFNNYICTKYPLDKPNNGKDLHCNKFINAYPKGAEEIIMKWAEENPVKTNGSKFLENYPNADVCGYRDNGEILFVRLDNSKPSSANGNRAEVPAEWWNKEIE